MTCRDGQYTIRKSIESWLNQSIPPVSIVIINDGSRDNSKMIIESYKKDNVVLIQQDNTPYDVKRICHNWNKGLVLTRYSDYHVIGTEDSHAEYRYSEKIFSSIDNMTLASSGTYNNKMFKSPVGICRFINNHLFEKIFNGIYPYRCGFESAILYEGLRLGYNNKVINDAVCYHSRQLGINHNFKEFIIGSILLGFSKKYIHARLLTMYNRKDITLKQLFKLIILTNTFKPYAYHNNSYYSMYDKTLIDYIHNLEKQTIRDKLMVFVK